MPTPEELAEEARIQAEMDGGGQKEPEIQDDPNEDNDTFSGRAEKEGLKAVPYPRFKKVYESEKASREHAKWRKENEPKLTATTQQIAYLRERVGKHPHMQKALLEILDSEDGQFNTKELLEALQKAAQAKPGDPNAEKPAALDPKAFKQELLEELRQENLVASVQNEISTFLSTGLQKVVKTDKDFDGIVADQDFADDVEAQLDKDTRTGKATGEDLQAEMLAAAKTVAKRYQAIQGRVLQRQVENGGRKGGAATIPTKPGAGAAKKKAPNPETDPDGYAAYIEENAEAFANSFKG